MQFIIFDLEATCWSGNTMGRRQEVIEIGAYQVNSFGEVTRQFQTFVRPVVNPTLSVFCRKLTGIKQENVDAAPEFGPVASAFVEWLQPTAAGYTLCSWGNADRTLLEDDCALHQVDPEWLEPYIDLKDQYHHLKGQDTRRGLKRTLAREGFDFEGEHHRALDDAANLVKLFIRYLDMWMY